jgi:hypothetical protein
LKTLLTFKTCYFGGRSGFDALRADSLLASPVIATGLG